MQNRLEKILLLQTEDFLLEIIKVSILAFFDVEIIVIKDKEIEKIGKLFTSEEPPTCLIIDESTSYNTLVRISKICQSTEKIIPIIGLYSPTSMDDDKLKIINFYAKIFKPGISERLKKVLSDFLPKRALIPQDENRFCEISLSVLLYFNQIETDLFLKLSESKHIKIFRAGDYFGENDFTKYKEKSVTSFYLSVKDIPFLLKKLESIQDSLKNFSLKITPTEIQDLAQNLSNEESRRVMGSLAEAIKDISSKNISFPQAVHICEETHEYIIKSIKTFGLNMDAHKLIKVLTILSLQTIKSSPKIEELWNIQQENNINTISTQYILKANISCMLAEMMGWRSNLTFYKLILASLMQDITLLNPKLVTIKNRPELLSHGNQFTSKEQDNYATHPETAALLASELNMIPPNVDIIIREHHERPDGTGFPKGINYHELSPLSCIFIAAHDVVHFIMSESAKGSQWNASLFLKEVEPIYKDGLFIDIYKILTKALAPKKK
ncbi:MAG: HD domain-containing phosphohydrolase [Bacteriovoracaceae bacterium]